MRILKIITAYLKLNLHIAMAYRANLAVELLTSLMWLAWELISLGVIYTNTDNLGGWSNGDMVVLLGVWKLVMAILFGIIFPNTEYFNKAVQQGTLDYTFLLPVNSQLLVSLNRITIWQIQNIAQALIMIPIGINMTGRGVALADFVMFLVLALSGMTLIYSLWIVLIAAVFWFTKFDNNVTILAALMDAGKYPVSIFPAWLRILITFVVPIAVATSVPVQALRGELPVWQVLAWLGFAVLVFLGAARVWRAGIRQYSGASA
ncbi:MAG: ABC-2 family transporter protein [Anaerolineae bacterium]|nr:ABC-2 family transporter protein [Anaerolineae bacterium]